MTEIEELADVIRRLHKAKAKHVESVHVTEVFQGKTVWDGMVEVFDLKGHPKTPGPMPGHTRQTIRNTLGEA